MRSIKRTETGSPSFKSCPHLFQKYSFRVHQRRIDIQQSLQIVMCSATVGPEFSCSLFKLQQGQDLGNMSINQQLDWIFFGATIVTPFSPTQNNETRSRSCRLRLEERPAEFQPFNSKRSNRRTAAPCVDGTTGVAGALFATACVG